MTNRYGWVWAFRKARRWNIAPGRAAWVATKYVVRGDSGRIVSRDGKIYRLVRREMQVW